MHASPPPLKLTASQLAALTRRAGVELGPLSPLHQFPESASHEAPVQLPDFGAADAALWTPVASTLAAPGLALTVSAGTSDSVIFLHAYGSSATGSHLLGCTPVSGSTYEIVPRLEHRAWLQVLSKGLSLEETEDTVESATALSHEALLACCGLVDAVKEARLEALIAREAYPEATAPARDIMIAAKSGLLTQDARWFTGLVRRLLPRAPAAVTLEGTSAGLRELEERGWVARMPEDDTWAFANEMSAAALEWSAAAVSGHFSLRVAGAREVHELHLGLIRTLSGLWTLECPAGQGGVKMGRSSGSALMGLLDKAVQTVMAPWQTAAPKHTASSPAPPAADGPAQFCVACGNRLVADARFCTHCGAPVPGGR